MTDQNDHQKPESHHDAADHAPQEGVPVESEPMEMETPRRAASAEFVVKSEVGSEAALREAMDPANQSLAEALRLSFRVLQVVIVALLGLFLVSGFQTIEEGQSGVRLVFNEIVSTGPDGAKFLDPGARLNWPYPVGEFYVFDVDNRSVDLGRTFWPDLRDDETFSDYASRVRVTSELRPGRDGYILTRGGDVGHMRMRANFRIDDPVQFVDRIDQSSRRNNAEYIVRTALKRAAVQQASQLELQEFVEFSTAAEEYEDNIRQLAQQILDELQTGIRLTSVRVHDTQPAAAVAGAYEDLQEAREEAATHVERARNDAEQELIRLAGPGYRRVLNLIDDYEEALQLEDHDAAETRLASIHEALEGPMAGGEVTAILQDARDYQSQIEMSLGNQTRRFRGLLTAYQQDPELVIKERWLRTYSYVLSQRDAEIYYAPPGGSDVLVRLFRSDHLKDERRQNMLERQRRDQRDDGDVFDRTMLLERADEMHFDRAGRMLPGGFRQREQDRDNRQRNR